MYVGHHQAIVVRHQHAPAIGKFLLGQKIQNFCDTNSCIQLITNIYFYFKHTIRYDLSYITQQKITVLIIILICCYSTTHVAT